MNAPKPRDLLSHFPEDTRQAAALLKQAVPLMVQHDLPPNPIHYALWYSYCQNTNDELNRRLDKLTQDYSAFPPELALKLFREHIIDGELSAARSGQQQTIELVDDLEGELRNGVNSSKSYQVSLEEGLQALCDPLVDDLPAVLADLQSSTQAMQSQQELFLDKLQIAQQEIKQLRRQLAQAHLAATVDELTQVFNRNSFNRLITHALSKPTAGLALIMLDIDHFKEFNDQYGHPLGDRVLQHVGQLLREQLPKQAMAARYGGEEFAVILNNCPDLNEVHKLAEQLRLKIQALRIKMRSTDKVLSTVTASFGIAMAQAGDDVEALITRADDALYQAKHAGRNQTYPAAGDASPMLNRA